MADLQAEADRVRDAAKWLLATLGAIGTIIVAGLQFSSIGAVPSGWRTFAAIAGAGGAIVGLVVLIGLVLAVMVPSDITIDAIARHKIRHFWLRRYLNQNPTWLGGYGNVDELYRAYLKALEDAKAGHGEAFAAAKDVDATVAYVTKGVAVEQLRWKLGWFRRTAALVAAAAVGVGIGAFAWGTNPPKAAGVSVSLRGADLTNADLRGSDLSDADLTGATLTGAKLAGVVWSNTICPDGTNSDGHGNTCLGHLHR